MGLFDALRRRGPQIDPWVQNLNALPLHVIYLNRNHVFTDNDGSPEAILEWATRNAQETNDLQDATLFDYPEGGLTLVPAFTNTDFVTPWSQQNPHTGSGITAMTVLRMKPGRLFKAFEGAPLNYVRVIVDPGQDHERILKEEEMRWLVKG